MSFDFEVQRWEDEDGNFHDGKPSDLNDTFGALVHAYDSDTGESHHFWAFTYMPFESWEDWLDYIEVLMDAHGMSMA